MREKRRKGKSEGASDHQLSPLPQRARKSRGGKQYEKGRAQTNIEEWDGGKGGAY